jgi:hypothetical protein
MTGYFALPLSSPPVVLDMSLLCLCFLYGPWDRDNGRIVACTALYPFCLFSDGGRDEAREEKPSIDRSDVGLRTTDIDNNEGGAKVALQLKEEGGRPSLGMNSKWTNGEVVNGKKKIGNYAMWIEDRPVASRVSLLPLCFRMLILAFGHNRLCLQRPFFGWYPDGWPGLYEYRVCSASFSLV